MKLVDPFKNLVGDWIEVFVFKLVKGNRVRRIVKRYSLELIWRFRPRSQNSIHSFRCTCDLIIYPEVCPPKIRRNHRSQIIHYSIKMLADALGIQFSMTTVNRFVAQGSAIKQQLS